MGDRERNIRDQVASGPFSAGQVSAEGSFRRAIGSGGGGYGGGGGGGYGGGRSGGPRIKSEGGAYGSIHSIKTEDGGYISSDEDAGDEGPRQDIDVIDISDDDEQGGARGMIPIRVSRVEHKEREKPVSTDSRTKEGATNAAADITSERRSISPTAIRKAKQRVRDIEVTGTQRRWRGAWSDSEDSEPDVRIKPEPTDDAIDMTAQPLATDPPIKESSSPDARRKSAKGRTKSHGLPTEAPSDLTVEERREWERHYLDLELIREELGQLAIPAPKLAPPTDTAEGETAPEATDAQGDTSMGDVNTEIENPAVEDRRADRVYLFQFPPILPELRIASGPGGVKKEAPPSPELSRRTKPNLTSDSSTNNNTEAAPINLDDIPDIAEATASAAKNSKENPVKVEDGNADIPASAGQSTYRDADAPSGYVGKLRVHASGRTTLDWGGTSLQVGMGTDVQFLQDVMVARFFDKEEKLEDIAGVGKKKDIKKEDRDEDKGPGGEVMGLGQVRGKFVVTPDWEEIVGQRI